MRKFKKKCWELLIGYTLNTLCSQRWAARGKGYTQFKNTKSNTFFMAIHRYRKGTTTCRGVKDTKFSKIIACNIGEQTGLGRMHNRLYVSHIPYVVTVVLCSQDLHNNACVCTECTQWNSCLVPFWGPGLGTAENAGHQAKAAHKEPCETHREYPVLLTEKVKQKIKLL